MMPNPSILMNAMAKMNTISMQMSNIQRVHANLSKDMSILRELFFHYILSYQQMVGILQPDDEKWYQFYLFMFFHAGYHDHFEDERTFISGIEGGRRHVHLGHSSRLDGWQMLSSLPC